MKKQKNDQTPLVLTRQQVRAFDAWAIQDLGIPGAVLMENAGRGCAKVILEHLAVDRTRSVTIVCGTGNNGGDGYVIARHLLNAGYPVRPILCGERDKVKGDALLHLAVLECMLGPIEVQEQELNLGNIQDNDLIVDALLGTGLQGRLRPPHDGFIAAMNRADCPVIAVDIPSGLDCDTGLPLGDSILAEKTVTFVAQKSGFEKKEAREYTGDIVVASIGIEPTFWPALSSISNLS